MAQILRTDSAKRDVSAIFAYIAGDNPPAAERWLDGLDTMLGVIARFPLIGEQVDYLAPGVRRHCYGKYLLFYRPIAKGIELHRVLHGARKIEELL
jgi:toxin ParE1/3/4